MKYQFVDNLKSSVKVIEDNNSFSKSFCILNRQNDQSNTDYQAYLKWLDEGNTPEPADEV